MKWVVRTRSDMFIFLHHWAVSTVGVEINIENPRHALFMLAIAEC
jgi:hypothetical protein